MNLKIDQNYKMTSWEFKNELTRNMRTFISHLIIVRVSSFILHEFHFWAGDPVLNPPIFSCLDFPLMLSWRFFDDYFCFEYSFSLRLGLESSLHDSVLLFYSVFRSCDTFFITPFNTHHCQAFILFSYSLFYLFIYLLLLYVEHL